MPCHETIYKLFKYERCYGNVVDRESVKKEYVIQNSNMNVLVDYIKNLSDEKNYTFCIQKFINNDLRWRQLLRHSNQSRIGWVKGDITTTWEKYVWDEKQQNWRSSNYRYDDEIIV